MICCIFGHGLPNWFFLYSLFPASNESRQKGKKKNIGELGHATVKHAIFKLDLLWSLLLFSPGAGNLYCVNSQCCNLSIFILTLFDILN